MRTEAPARDVANTIVRAGYIQPLSIEILLDAQGRHICRPYRKTAKPVVGEGFIPSRGAMKFAREIRFVFAIMLAFAAIGASAADRDQLLYHAETLKGTVLQSQSADTPFNPASLVKVGTSLWALESLGPEHRYRTVFGIDGEWDKQTGRLVGSLVVQGWGDPDMQPENVFLIARQLNKLRLFRVEGCTNWTCLESNAMPSENPTVEPYLRSPITGCPNPLS